MVTDKVILQEIKQTCLEKLISTAEEENVIVYPNGGVQHPANNRSIKSGHASLVTGNRQCNN